MNKAIFSKPEKFDSYKESMIKGLLMWKESIQKPVWTGVLSSAYSGAVGYSGTIAYLFYLENNIDTAIEYAEKIASHAMDYFYGNWRSEVPTDEKTIDPVWWKRNGGWIDEFRHAMLWTTALGQWDKMCEIAAYPTPECVEYLPIKVNPYLACYLCLAVVMRGEKLAAYQKYVEIVERGTRKKERLMIEVLKAIDGRDKEAFDRAFADYLKYYKQREFPKDEFDDKVTIEGTILFNTARHYGMPVEFPEAYTDYYVDLKKE